MELNVIRVKYCILIFGVVKVISVPYLSCTWEFTTEIGGGEPRKGVWEASRVLRVWNSAKNNRTAWRHRACRQAPSQQQCVCMATIVVLVLGILVFSEGRKWKFEKVKWGVGEVSVWIIL